MIQLLGLELRATVRSAVPSATARRVLVAALALTVVALCALAVAAPTTDSRTMLARLGGITLGTVAAGFGAALLACGGIAMQPERVRLARLAPSSSAMPVVARIAPTVLLAIGPIALFVLPLVIGLLRVDAGAAAEALIGLVLAGACAIGAAFLVAASLIRLVGAVRSGPVLRSVGGGMFILTLSQYPAALRAPLGAIDPVALALTGFVVALILFVAGARAFAASLGESSERRTVAPPVWGVAPFARLVSRSASVPTLAIGIIAGFAAAWLDAPMRWGVGALLVVMCASLPTGAALQAEDERRERWRLAPSTMQAWLALLFRVALPAFAVSAVLGVVLGWGRWNWMVAVLALAFSAALAATIVSPRVRLATLVPLLLAALATQQLD